MNKLFGEEWITLKYIQRYPNSVRTKSWANKIVAIQTDSNYWKANGRGYTYRPNAAAYHFPDAVSWTKHLTDRHTVFHLHSVITHENHVFDPSGRGEAV